MTYESISLRARRHGDAGPFLLGKIKEHVEGGIQIKKQRRNGRVASSLFVRKKKGWLFSSIFGTKITKR
jgi:hypothetical protein